MIRVVCANCGKGFRAPIEAAGRQVNCPNCFNALQIPNAQEQPQSRVTAPSRPEISAAVPPPPPVQRKPVVSDPPAFARVSDFESTASKSPPAKAVVETVGKSLRGLPTWALILITALPCLALGYFGGREHLRYQMTSALRDLGKAFAGESEESAASGSVVEAASPASAASVTATAVASKPAESVPENRPEKPAVPQVQLGKSFSSEFFDLRVVSASIGLVKVKDFMGDTGTSKDEQLQVEFELKNTHDRKILRFDENMFMTKFALRDDVDNRIRGVSFGPTKILGAIDSSDDILPGSTVTHIEVFSVPPPNTKALTLTVDLEVFGGEGAVEYLIPFDQVKNN